MLIFDKLRYKYVNASDRAQYEIKVLLVLLCLALLINIPSLIRNMKTYSEWKASSSLENDWATSEPEQQGMNGELLANAGKFLGDKNFSSFLVVRHGVLVHEQYYNGSSKYYYNNVYSVTKSVISALVGISIEKGLMDGINEKLVNYFPEYCSKADPDFGSITVENLLTMTPGFCEDLNSWTQQKNITEATFSLPLKYKPGEEFQYANSATHLLSGILTKATQMSTFEFAEQNLFKPLGIEKKQWAVDGQGIFTGYANLYLRPRDMAKFGQLYLNHGKWQGNQIVPETWVSASTKIQFEFKNADADSSNGNNGDNSENSNNSDNSNNSGNSDINYSNLSSKAVSGYGYKWWIDTVSDYKVFSAVGYGGQGITVVPDLDIVMVYTARPDTPVGPVDDPRMTLLDYYVIPSVRDMK